MGPRQGRLLLLVGAAVAVVAFAATGCSAAPQVGSAPTASTGTARPTTAVGHAQADPGPQLEAPQVGTTLLASLPTGGRVNVIGNADSGFSVLRSITSPAAASSGRGAEQSTLTTFDAAGNQLASLTPGSMTGECGAADVTPGGHRLVITASVTSTPAQGVNPARYSESLVAWDALTGQQVWETELVPAQETDLHGDCTAFDGQLFSRNSAPPMITITNDGRYGALHVAAGSDGEVGGVIELATGRMVSTSEVLGTLGNYVVTGTDATDTSGPTQTVTVAAPPDLSTQGSAQLTSYLYGPGVLVGFPTGSSTGVFNVVSAGSSPGSGVSRDGETLFTYEYTESRAPFSLKAYRLPEMAVLWTQAPPAGIDLQLVAEGGGVLIGRSIDQATRTQTMVGIDAATGAQRWTLPSFDVCGITRTQLLASANNQLAVIDLPTGTQLSYGESGASGRSGTAVCPMVLPGGAAISGTTGPLTQTLTP